VLENTKAKADLALARGYQHVEPAQIEAVGQNLEIIH